MKAKYKTQIGALCHLVEWTEHLNVSCDDVDSSGVIGLQVMFRGVDITSQLTKHEREACELILIEGLASTVGKGA